MVFLGFDKPDRWIAVLFPPFLSIVSLGCPARPFPLVMNGFEEVDWKGTVYGVVSSAVVVLLLVVGWSDVGKLQTAVGYRSTCSEVHV